jgi:acyl-CoA synthetase (AMP-forming)/AMP-acid ligase II
VVSAFRDKLAAHLETNANRVLLRVLVSRTDAAPIELTGGDLLRRSRELAGRFPATPAGGVVLLLLPHSLELFLLQIGMVLTGRLPAILAWPTTRVDPRKYRENLLHQLSNLPAGELITLPGLARTLDAGLPYLVSPLPVPGTEAVEKAITVADEQAPTAKRPYQPSTDTPAEALFLQFSGGTTGAQKCVVVTAPMLERQLARLQETLAFDPATDGVASWLPMYHDMGLIACLWFPLWTGAPSFHCAATDWLLEPDLLFGALAKYKATFCWLPNFAFSYLAGARDRMKRGPYALGHVRGYVDCSEPVRLRSLRAFAEAFADWGVHEGQLQASYAMAENVFAVTQTPLGALPAQYARSAVRKTASESSALAFDLLDDVYVSSGPPLKGVEIRIHHADGTPVAENETGGIEIRTESLFAGYWGNDGFKTSARVDGGWYQTGDYGFTAGGELYVIGRTKDIIIVGGQNIFPEDVEAIANTVPGVYTGRVVAFGAPDEAQGTEALCAVAEMRGDYDEKQAAAIAAQIRALVVASIGVAPRFVWVKPERWIVKSTAGKISRKETRRRFLEERANERTP